MHLVLRSVKYGIRARASLTDQGFTILKESTAQLCWRQSKYLSGYAKMHEKLVADGTIIRKDERLGRFVKDVAFKSPSAAAAVVLGRQSNRCTDGKLKRAANRTALGQRDPVAEGASGLRGC